MRKPEDLKHWDVLMLFLSLYILGSLTASAFPIPEHYKLLFHYIDFVICIIFLADFLMRLVTSRDKWRYLRWGWIDLVSAVPMIHPLRYGRLFQVYRLVQLLRGFRSVGHVIRHFYHDRAKGAFYTTAMISFIVLVFGSIAVLQFETQSEGGNITSAREALWWAIVTMTTVGYGEYYPVTVGGRIVATLLMLSGIGLIGTLTGYVASFIRGDEQKAHQNAQAELLLELRDIKEELARLRRETRDR